MAPSKTHRLLNNVRAELKKGKNRSRNGGRDHTEEETAALVKKRDRLIRKQADEAETARQNIIAPINSHTTEETDRAMRHMTAEVNRGLIHTTVDNNRMIEAVATIAAVATRKDKDESKRVLITELPAASSSSAMAPTAQEEPDMEDNTEEDILLDNFMTWQNEVYEKGHTEYERKVLEAGKEFVSNMWSTGQDLSFSFRRDREAVGGKQVASR